jgi:hypothetical protein
MLVYELKLKAAIFKMTKRNTKDIALYLKDIPLLLNKVLIQIELRIPNEGFDTLIIVVESFRITQLLNKQ